MLIHKMMQIGKIQEFLESEAGDKIILLLLILYFGVSAWVMNVEFYYRIIDLSVGALIMKIKGGNGESLPKNKLQD